MSYTRYNESVVIEHQRCPKCEAEGRDRHGDNLAVYSDGHQYCFACHYRVPSPNSLSNIHKRLENVHQETSSPFNSDRYGGMLQPVRGELPPKARAWLHKYGITNREYQNFQLFYENNRELLCFPVYEHEKLVYYNGRYFGPEPKHSKYTAVGHKPTNPVILRTNKNSSVFIAVEDYVSAIKISRQFNAICLFGTYLKSYERLHQLLNPIKCNARENKLGRIHFRIWLDFDKYRESIRQAARARQYIPDSATIVTPKDPKCYNDEEINEFVSSTIESVS